MKSLKEIQAGFKKQALSPEDPNWALNIHTSNFKNFFEKEFGTEKKFNVLDVGSGKSRVSESLRPYFPNAHFTGMDFVQESLDVGIKKNRIDDGILLDLSRPYAKKPQTKKFDIAFSTRTMFFLTPKEILNALAIVSDHLKPKSFFLCQYFFTTPAHTQSFIDNFRNKKTQYRSLETLEAIYGIYNRSSFKVDKDFSENSILQKEDEEFPTILITAQKQ